MALNLSHPAFTRFFWLLAAITIAAGLPWLDKNRAGNLNEMTAAVFVNSLKKGADSTYLTLGSSRIWHAFEPYYINSIFRNEGLESTKIERMALSHSDPVTPYFLLKNRIKNGKPPKAIILEVLLVESPASKDSIFETRKSALLTVAQQKELLRYEASPDFDDTTAYLNLYVNRYTSLFYGLVKHPRPSFWSADYWNRNGGKSFSAPRRDNSNVALGNSKEEVKRVAMGLRKKAKRKRKALARRNSRTSNGDALNISALTKQEKRKQRRSAFQRKMEKYNYRPKRVVNRTVRIHGNYRLNDASQRKRINSLRRICELADRNGIKVILVTMIDYNQVLSGSERKKLQSIFPKVEIYNVQEQAGDTVLPFWSDKKHLTKEGALLTSALLAQKLVQDFHND